MPHYTTWDDGSYSVIAQQIGGTWLCIWVLISSVFGNLGLYVAEMAKDGFQLAGMADSGLAPPYFAQYVSELMRELYRLNSSAHIYLFCTQTSPGHWCPATSNPAGVLHHRVHGHVRL